MQKEMKKLQSAKREHNKLLRDHNATEKQLKSLVGDVLEMKKTKVSDRRVYFIESFEFDVFKNKVIFKKVPAVNF